MRIEYPDTSLIVRWDFSAEYRQIEPVVDEFPVQSLCIKEQMYFNDQTNGEPTIWVVPDYYLERGKDAVNALMQEMADNRKVRFNKMREAYTNSLVKKI